jgi:hypothetical protein
MALFSEYTKEELESESAVTLTLAELRALQLSSSGDVFAPGSLLSINLESAASKLDIALDRRRAGLAAERMATLKRG